MNNIRTPLIRAVLATALVGGALAVLPSPRADALDAGTASVDAAAPIEAVLLPTVVVAADASHPEAATTHVVGHALPVTLLPTVRVNARGGIAASDVAARADALVAADAPAPRLPALDPR
ncbi:MAG: hypothetical protein GXC76_15590 [Rhodanobacteraceae bacterium]|jgi:formylmethanofuran:tetrahydromethanopterin formyltransferase|nr:hypothetical protein [Rhodanobacteraceae bacterium]